MQDKTPTKPITAQISTSAPMTPGGGCFKLLAPAGAAVAFGMLALLRRRR